MNQKIIGIEKLTEKQKNHLIKCNEKHTNQVWEEYESGMAIVETWVEDGVVCAKLAKGKWYYYYEDGTWG